MKITKMEFLKNELREACSEAMNFVDVMERIYNKTRGQHNTVALLTAAKQHKGLIVCHTKKWADELSKREGIDACVYTDSRIWTYDGPILMDLPCMFEFVKGQARISHTATKLLEFMDQKGVD